VLLCALTLAPPAKWSSDRVSQIEPPQIKLFRRRQPLRV
jgi:hypothetical protein